MTPKKFKFQKSLFFNNQTISTLSIFHMYDVPINLPVYQTPSGRDGDITVILSPAGENCPGGVGHLSKNALMLLDFSKNWYPEVKFYGEFKNLGPEISTYPHFPQLPTIISLPICHHIGKCGWLQILGYRFLNSPYNFTSRYQFLEKSNNIKGYF